MSEVKIEKGIPVPSRRPKSGKYPFSEMEVGDSFVIHPDNGGLICGAARIHKLNHPGMNFTTRKLSDTESRCWRIA